jgi:hypothetical protein
MSWGFCRGLTFRQFDIATEDAALASVVAAFLRPVEFATNGGHGNADAPFAGIGTRTRIA